MYDMLPFPNITATNAEEQVAQINNYLIQFKETLEFILTNISVDNLSQDLIDRLNALGSDIEKSHKEREEEIQQVSGKMLTVSDVINSSTYKADQEAREAEVQKNREDIETLSQTIQSVSDRVLTIPEIIASEEYQKDMDEMETEIQQKVEANLPTASEILESFEITVNYDTGHLEY